MRGRNISPYHTPHGDLWLIATFPALELSIGNYPAIKAHLETHREKLTPKPHGFRGQWPGRKAGKYRWFETQDPTAYHEKFGEEKLIFTKAAKEPAFVVDEDGRFALNTAYIMTGKAMKYLAAILNSALAGFAFRKFYIGGGIEGEITVFSLAEFPVPRVLAEKRRPLESLVDKITAAKRADPDADTSEWEAEIDRRVCALYGLTAAEVRLVESGGE